jgi:hypothetical protein
MTILSTSSKSRDRLNSLRPLFFGIPTFVIISIFLVWSLARLASWIFALLDVAK